MKASIPLIYKPFGKPLIHDDDGEPIALSCRQCGRFTLNTETGLCASCNLNVTLPAINAWVRSVREHARKHDA